MRALALAPMVLLRPLRSQILGFRSFSFFCLSCFSSLLFVNCSSRLLPYLLRALELLLPLLFLLHNFPPLLLPYFVFPPSSTSPYPRPLAQQLFPPAYYDLVLLFVVSFPTRNTSRNLCLCQLLFLPAFPGHTADKHVSARLGIQSRCPSLPHLPRSCYNVNLISLLSRSGMCLGLRLPCDHHPSNQTTL